MAEIFKTIQEGKIDFYGQEAVDIWTRTFLGIATSVSFVLGLVLQNLRVTFGVFGGAVILVLILSLPPWSYLNRSPVAWQKGTTKKDN